MTLRQSFPSLVEHAVEQLSRRGHPASLVFFSYSGRPVCRQDLEHYRVPSLLSVNDNSNGLCEICVWDAASQAMIDCEIIMEPFRKIGQLPPGMTVVSMDADGKTSVVEVGRE